MNEDAGRVRLAEDAELTFPVYLRVGDLSEQMVGTFTATRTGAPGALAELLRAVAAYEEQA